MPFYELQPDPVGEHGENLALDESVHPPRVTHLHIEIDNWVGDDLAESYPCYVVTEGLAQALNNAGIGAYQLREAEVTMADEGRELIDELGLSEPKFQWLDVSGTACEDDIGTTAGARLVVSDRALELLRQFRLDRCDVEEYVS